MKLRCLACEVFSRPLYHYSANSPHVVDISLFKRGLHNTPNELNKYLKEQIKATTDNNFEAILLAYGLCGKATLEIQALNIPIVIPKAHDCITLFLGSRDRYNQEFSKTPGTYWYTQDSYERQDVTDETFPLGSYEIDVTENLRKEYVKKYGEENAEFLLKTLDSWQKHYQRAALIDTGFGEISKVELFAKKQAKKNSWQYEKLKGNLEILRKLVFGEWDNDFLVVDPGKKITMTFDDEIIAAR